VPSTEFARIGWWEGDTFQHSHALLLNVSQSGLLLLVDEAPPEHKHLFVCLGGPSPTEWVEVDLVDLFRTPRGPHRAHLRFHGLCPYEFFKAAVYGISFLIDAAFTR
jgi:hypothetical protein